MLLVELPFPPSVNHYYRNVKGVMVISAEGREYRRTVNRLIGTKKPLACTLYVEIVATPPDKRRRDLDNLLKASLDAITKANVWLDDSQIVDLRIKWSGETDKTNPRICVLIKEAL